MLLGMEPFLSRGSGEMKRGKTAITFPVIFPLWWLAPPPFPRFAVGLWALGRGVNSGGNMVLLSLASSLGEEGHEVAKGCWRVRIGKKLKVE